MPTLQQLRYLAAVAETLHFRRAAEACNVTQPTLSAQLKELELKLGTALVERSRTRVILTPTGAAIAARAQSILREVADIRALAKAGNTFLDGTVRMGVVQSLGSYFLPLIVPDLHRSHPRLGLYMREGLPDDLLRGVEDGALDFLVFPLPLDRGDLVTLPLFREPFHVVAPQDHPLAQLPEVPPRLLAGETILTLEPGHKLYEQVRALCDTYGAEVSRDFEGTSLDTLRQMVAMGMGVSLMPALYVKSEVAHQDIVVARPIAADAPARTIGMVWRRSTAYGPELQALASRITAILRSRAPELDILS